MIEDYRVELVCHHRFRMYTIIRRVSPTYPLHRSVFFENQFIKTKQNQF